jgi:ssDNA-binding Zn-finger/Zn-ribbon topoisomerase 1
MPLHLVPPTEPSSADGVHLRAKKAPRPDGMLQCPRCGCRTSLTTINGQVVKDGRKQGGTKIDVDECAECWKRGAHVSMLPTGPKPAT